MKQFRTQSIAYLKHNIINIQPKNNRDILIQNISPFIKNNSSILIPSAKTGEFIYDIKENNTSLDIHACEEKTELFETIKDISGVTTYNLPFLHLSAPFNFNHYDIILGTLPSYNINKKTTIGNKFKHWFVSKTDIYSIYFMRAIDLLKHQGIAAFIIPNSFCNSQYLQLLRNKIDNHGTILKIQNLSNHHTKTIFNSILIVFKKDKIIKDDYFFRFFSSIFYTNNKPLYKNIYNNSTNLAKLNAHIQTGQYTYNLERTNNEKLIPIIYYKNISHDNTLQLYKNNKQYIHPDNINFKVHNFPSLIISKIIGNKKDELFVSYSSCSLDKYICNDNLFVISFPKLNNEDAIILITSIIKSFKKQKTKTWFKHFIKDGVISKYQLKFYLPIYDISF